MISEKQSKKFCKDDITEIENYELAINDTSHIWHCHHRRESIYTRDGLKEIGEYFHRPACELVFLSPSEHAKLHFTGKNNKGDNNPMYGKKHTEETKKKISKRAFKKPILQYTKDGVFIKEWISAFEASNVLGIDRSSIVKICRGKKSHKSLGGFVWRYKQ